MSAVVFIIAVALLVVLSGCARVQPQKPPPGTRSIGVTPTRFAAKTVGREWFSERAKDSGLQPRVKP